MATLSTQSSSSSHQALHTCSSQGPRSSKYPKCLTSSTEFPHTLDLYTEVINRNVSSIFQPGNTLPIWFCDLDTDQDGVLKCGESPKRGLSELEQHLEANKKAPRHRFIHIRSLSSRDPIACSREEMDLILTNHQVMAPFVDVLLQFKVREKPQALTTFRIEDHLEPVFHLPRLKSLNMSGIRIQHCFTLLGIERDKKVPGNWLPRQVGAYHSFDVLEARSIWLLLKGDATIRTRLTAATKSTASLTKSNHPLSLGRSFGETLKNHLLILQWCAEGWAEYSEHMENECREATVMTRADIQGLVEDAPKWEDEERKAITAGQDTTDTEPGLIGRLSRRVSSFGGKQTPGMHRSSTGMTGTPETTHPDNQIKNKNMKLSKEEVFSNLQALRGYAVDIQDMMSRLEQSARVVESIATRYHNLVRSRRFTQHLNDEQIIECQEHVEEFSAQLRIISGSLESFRSRLRTTHDCTEHEGDVFNHIMQAYSMSTADFYARSSRRSADAMQDMTKHMHNKTVSMHVITIFTLIFLPGTFVATVFSSGILTFGNEGDIGFGTEMGDWKVRVAGLKLFFVICIPLLAFTLSAWFLVYWLARRERRLDAMPATDEEKGDAEEKKGRLGENGGKGIGGGAVPVTKPSGQPGQEKAPQVVAVAQGA